MIVGCYDNNQYKFWLREIKSVKTSRHFKDMEGTFPHIEWYDIGDETVEIDLEKSASSPSSNSQHETNTVNQIPP